MNDESTLALVLDFHGCIRRAVPKDEALRAGMRGTATHPGWEHPLHWAAFFPNSDR